MDWTGLVNVLLQSFFIIGIGILGLLGSDYIELSWAFSKVQYETAILFLPTIAFTSPQPIWDFDSRAIKFFCTLAPVSCPVPVPACTPIVPPPSNAACCIPLCVHLVQFVAASSSSPPCLVCCLKVISRQLQLRERYRFLCTIYIGGTIQFPQSPALSASITMARRSRAFDQHEVKAPHNNHQAGRQETWSNRTICECKCNTVDRLVQHSK